MNEHATPLTYLQRFSVVQSQGVLAQHQHGTLRMPREAMIRYSKNG